MTEAQVLDRIKRKMAESPDEVASALIGEMVCPCCQKYDQCAPDCTFADDDPAASEHMDFVRLVVLGGV